MMLHSGKVFAVVFFPDMLWWVLPAGHPDVFLDVGCMSDMRHGGMCGVNLRYAEMVAD